MRQNPANLLKVGDMVGDDQKLSANLEDAADIPDERHLDQSPSLVPALRPGIGEVDVNTPDRAIGQAAAEEVRRVCFNDPDIRKAVPANPISRVGAITRCPLNAQEVQLRPGRRPGKEERPLPRTNLHLNRSAVAEKLGEDRGYVPRAERRKDTGGIPPRTAPMGKFAG